MGKKNKKSRRHDDEDDLLFSTASTNQDELNHGDNDSTTGDTAPVTATAAESETASWGKTKNKGGAKRNVDIDPMLLEDTMTTILQNCDEDRSDEWLCRTMEKNMHLPKHSLRESVEPSVLEEMMARVRSTLEREREERAEGKGRWDSLVAEMCEKSELTAKDQTILRAEAHEMGVDADDAVAAVIETIREKASNEKSNNEIAEKLTNADGERGRGDLDNIHATDASFSVSILLTLQPYLRQPPSQHSSFAKLFSVLRRYTCLLLYTAFSLLLGNRAKTDAEDIYERFHLPSVEAARLAKETEEDDRMLRNDTHLWSDQRRCWIEKGATYSHSHAPSIPPTVRWNGARKQWERWSKNLTTRTKATRRAEAAGEPTALAKGTFVRVRAGEGWATAPDQPETGREGIAVGGILFLACLPAETEEPPEVVDVTSWATGTLLTREAARELEAVDSGRELFSFDVASSSPSDKKKGGRKGRVKNDDEKKKRNDGGGNTDREGEEANSVARKGIGCTAKVVAKYLDRS